MPDLNGRRIAILATDMVEQVELVDPRGALEKAIPAFNEKMLEVFAKAPVGARG